MRTIYLILLIFFASYFRASPVWAVDCQTYRMAYKVLESHSMFKISDRKKFRKRVWSRYLYELDPYKMHFTYNQAKILKNSRLQIDFSSISQVCNNIEKTRDFLSKRISEIQEYLPSLQEMVNSKLYQDQSTKLRIVIDPQRSSYVQGPELEQRWSRRIVYENRKLSHYPMNLVSQMTLDYVQDQHKIMSSSYYHYIAFIKALFSEVDPHSYFYRDAQILPHHHFISVAPVERQRKNSFKFMNPVEYNRFFFGHYGRISRKTLLPGPLEFVWTHPKKKTFDFPNFSFINSGDRVIPFLDENQQPNIIQYLKKTYQGYEWHKIKRNRDSFRLFSAPLQYMVSIFKGKKDHKDHQDNQNLHRQMNALGYIYFNSPWTKGMNPQEDVQQLSRKLYEALRKMEEDYRTPVRVIILDLRSSSLRQLPMFLESLSTFLPKKPALRIQNQEGEHTVYATKVPAYTTKSNLVVLVNQHTISLSEMMAATLKEYGKALIIGEGLGRSSGGMSGARKQYHEQFGVTNHFYFTPSGKSLDGKGLTPHITLPLEVDLPSSEKQALQKFYTQHAKIKDLSPLTDLCTSPLPETLIEELKARSYDRILKRLYPRLKAVKEVTNQTSEEKIEKHWISFQEAFELTEQQLRSEKPATCDHKYCGTVSLAREDYQKNNALFKYRSKQISSSLLKPQNYSKISELALEDPVLWESIHIAIDYHRYLKSLPYISIDWDDYHKNSNL